MKTTSSKISRINDKAIINDLAGKVFSANRRKLPIIIAFFYYIIKFLLAVGAYIPRSILRKKLGERTFGLITVLSVYLFFSFVQIVVDAIPVAIERVNEGLRALNIDQIDRESAYDIVEAYLLLTSTSQGEDGVSMIKTITLTSIFRDAVKGYQGLSTGLWYLWWIIIAFSLMHFIELMLRKRREEVIHSFHRGRSAFNILSGKKILGLEIKERYLWMYVEPVTVYLIALSLGFIPGIGILSLVLKISAACLFLEEYRVFLENKSMVLDVIDSQIDGMKLAQVQEEFMEKLTIEKGQDNLKSDSLPTVSID
ncbi:MAG: hypothetical protein J5I98_20785 [Phaeodactylibacter sp.]|nr:hypothetical protein [Phaeodactylibacter sp.]